MMRWVWTNGNCWSLQDAEGKQVGRVEGRWGSWLWLCWPGGEMTAGDAPTRHAAMLRVRRALRERNND